MSYSQNKTSHTATVTTIIVLTFVGVLFYLGFTGSGIYSETVGVAVGSSHVKLNEQQLIDSIQAIQDSKFSAKSDYQQVFRGGEDLLITNAIFDFDFELTPYRAYPYTDADKGYRLFLYKQIGTSSTGTPMFQTRAICKGVACNNSTSWDWR